MDTFRVYICPDCGYPQKGFVSKHYMIFKVPSCMHCSYVFSMDALKNRPIQKLITERQFVELMNEFQKEHDFLDNSTSEQKLIQDIPTQIEEKIRKNIKPIIWIILLLIIILILFR